MERCWDADVSKRPNSFEEIVATLEQETIASGGQVRGQARGHARGKSLGSRMRGVSGAKREQTKKLSRTRQHSTF